MSSTIKKYQIVGNSYQSISTSVNGKMFYTPKKNQSITREFTELPKTLVELHNKNLIIIREIK